MSKIKPGTSESLKDRLYSVTIAVEKRVQCKPKSTLIYAVVTGHFKGRMREWGHWGRIREVDIYKNPRISQSDLVLLIGTYLKEKQISVFMTRGNGAG